MNITILGAYNCESRDTKMASVLLDDILILDAGSITSSLPLSAQNNLKLILLTHQHYDHIKDIPILAMNLYLSGSTINICSTRPVYEAISTHLMQSKLYPNFFEQPQENPTLNSIIIEPNKPRVIEDFNILAIPMNHSVPSVGFQITSPTGSRLFYTGDTGPGLGTCWQKISPQVLVIEVTAPDRFEEFCRVHGHLTPILLKQELINYKKLKGFIPQVVIVHMNPLLYSEIECEIAKVAVDIDAPILMGFDGKQISIIASI